MSDLDRLFDALIRFDEATQQARKIKELRADLRRIGTVCGDCALWMTRACPQETNVNGWNRGPSCAAPICSKFVETQQASERREKLKKEITILCDR